MIIDAEQRRQLSHTGIKSTYKAGMLNDVASAYSYSIESLYECWPASKRLLKFQYFSQK